MDLFDLVAEQWNTLTTTPTPRYLSSLVVLDDVLHLIGGFIEGDFHTATNKMETYDIKEGKWTETTECPFKIWEHLSCVLYIPTCREDEEL